MMRLDAGPWPLVGYLVFPCGCTHRQVWDDYGNVVALEQQRCKFCAIEHSVEISLQCELPLHDRDRECDVDHRQMWESPAMLELHSRGGDATDARLS